MKSMCTSTGNKSCPGTVWEGELTMLVMTLMGWLGCKNLSSNKKILRLGPELTKYLNSNKKILRLGPELTDKKAFSLSSLIHTMYEKKKKNQLIKLG